MNKQLKRFIALGLTISLASVPTLSEVSRAKEISEVKHELSISSEALNDTLLNLEADRLSNEDLALLTLQQPIIDSPIEGMKDFPEQQQAMKEHAKTFLDETSFELRDTRNRADDLAAITESYMSIAASKVGAFENGEITEEQARNDIQSTLERLNTSIEREARTVEQSQERVENFHSDVEKDYKELESSVKKAEEILIEQGDLTEEEVREINEEFAELYSEQGNQNSENLRVATIASSITDGPIDALSRKVVSFSLLVEKETASKISEYVLVMGSVLLWLGISLAGLTFLYKTIFNDLVWGDPNYDWANPSSTNQKVRAFTETTENIVTDLDSHKKTWSESQEYIQIVIDKVANGDDLSTLKLNFEESSVSWGNTQNIANSYQQIESNTSDDVVEINLDNIETEEELEDALKEVFDTDGLIDTSEMTDEELEEWLREVLEEELEEAA